MDMEGLGKANEARQLFLQAWNECSNDFERFIAAHYVARQTSTLEDKLRWDETALKAALKIDDDSVKTNYPSLYLNIGKGYEDLKDFENAKQYYQLAFSYTDYLPNDGYGRLIKSGIRNGIDRLSKEQ